MLVDAVRSGELTLSQAARLTGRSRKAIHVQVWKAVRDEVLARDGACVMYGCPDGGLDVHHRHCRGSGGTQVADIAYGMANLVTLCRAHHCWVEANPDEARELGLRLDAGQVPREVAVLRFGQDVLLDDEGTYRLDDAA